MFGACSKAFVCRRYATGHHCRTCCPLDVMLMGEPAEAAHHWAPPGGARLATPSSPPHQTAAAWAGQALQERDSPAVERPAPPGAGATPGSQLPGTPRAAPPAPTKSHTSGGTSASRGATSAAVRSLIPVFNGFTAAARRANQLGGRFATLRPDAHNIARLQRQVAAPTAAAPAGGDAACRKRGRQLFSGPGGEGTALSSPASVSTVSRGAEPRVTTWIRPPAPEPCPAELPRQ
jgi:hypothetical protein